MVAMSKKIAFVSGKGGAGKTVLAANFAFCSSTNCRTLLVDLDFQNQGSTGLLAQYLKPGCLNAFDIFTERTESGKPVEVRSNLFFIPAFDPARSDRFGSQLTTSFHSAGFDKLFRFLDNLLSSEGFDRVVLDCHGGLDDVSFAAFIYSDTTMIVTEADKVTFNGTLELLDFYIGRAATITREITNPKSKEMNRFASTDRAVVHRVFHVEENKVRIIVNRVSGKFSYNALKQILAQQFYDNIKHLSAMNEGFYFVPGDPLVGESFSEYPFYFEVMPESIFSQKIEQLYEQVTGEKPVVHGRSMGFRLFERMRATKLERYLRSPYDVRVQAVFSFIAISQTLFFILVISLIPGIPGIPWERLLPNVPTKSQTAVGVASIVFCFGVFCLYLTRFDVQISQFFRDRLRYEIRLYRKAARRRSVSFVLRIVRVFLFRFFMLLGAALFLLSGIGYVIMSIVVAFSGGFP
jgi:cellulose biosynthesis protein BcsQ